MTQKTRETILASAKIWGNLSEKEFLAVLKEKGINGRFNEELWDKYWEVIEETPYWKERHPMSSAPSVCEICGEPLVCQHYANIPIWSYWGCPIKSHGIIILVANIIGIFNPEMSRQELLNMAMGPICEHGKHEAECRKCFYVKTNQKFEEAENNGAASSF
jgi:hypothetical protein